MNQFKEFTMQFAGCELKIPTPSNLAVDEIIQRLIETGEYPFLEEFPWREAEENKVVVDIEEDWINRHFNFNLESDDDGNEYYITRLYPMEDVEEEEYLIIPNTYKGLPVKAVKGSSTDFVNSFRLKRLYIPKNIIEIRRESFLGLGIESIPIWGNVKSIESFAFCQNLLRSVILPPTVRYIDVYAFQQNAIYNLKLNEGLQKIGMGAFSTNQIAELVIPEGITSIPSACFSDNLLLDVRIPETVLQINHEAFARNHLTEVNLPSSLIKIATMAFTKNELRELYLPDTLQEIGEAAFSDNELTLVSISKGVQYVANSAFINNKIHGNSFILR